MLSRVSSYFLANVRQIQNIMLNIFKIKKRKYTKNKCQNFSKRFHVPTTQPTSEVQYLHIKQFLYRKKEKSTDYYYH